MSDRSTWTIIICMPSPTLPPPPPPTPSPPPPAPIVPIPLHQPCIDVACQADFPLPVPLPAPPHIPDPLPSYSSPLCCYRPVCPSCRPSTSSSGGTQARMCDSLPST